MKKKFKNFLKQLGDSPKKKRNISANVSEYPKFAVAKRKRIWVEALERAVTGYSLLSDVIKSFCFAKQNII